MTVSPKNRKKLFLEPASGRCPRNIEDEIFPQDTPKQQSEDWDGYWQLLSSLLDERYDTRPVHSLDEILLLHSRFPENIKLYTATLDGELLAGVVMYLSHPVAHCQYIGASPRGKVIKALTLLFQNLISEFQQSGYRYFDFGISNEDHGRYLNEGLVRQKSRLGGRGIVYNTFKVTL